MEGEHATINERIDNVRRTWRLQESFEWGKIEKWGMIGDPPLQDFLF